VIQLGSSLTLPTLRQLNIEQRSFQRIATSVYLSTMTDQQPPTSKITLSPQKLSKLDPSRILNLNVGVLGHVDSGKTSLVKTLSTLLSTASLDKSSQSRQRGITLDLGFSAFLMPLPPSIISSSREDGDDDTTDVTTTTDDDAAITERYDLMQVTLVDCPGHASLIRTIIGGAQIIDMVLLVIDATKGVQTQTAECLVIAEMTTQNLIVVLNKVDLFAQEEREDKLKEVEASIRAVLKKTRFANASMVGISACVGGEKVAAATTSDDLQHQGKKEGTLETQNIQGLLDTLQRSVSPPNRDEIQNTAFHFSIDHCFPIKGQGTVLTGTCLAGSLKVNEMVEFPTLSFERKVKSMQMFRRKVTEIKQGDRAGICVANLDPNLMERGVAASPGSVRLISGALAVVKKVRYYRGSLASGTKFHVSVGHTTVMATVTFWGAREIALRLKNDGGKPKLENNEHIKMDNISTKKNTNDSEKELKSSSLGGNADIAGLPHMEFDFDEDFLQQEDYIESIEDSEGEESGSKMKVSYPLHFCSLDFQTPVYCPLNSLIIGSRLDTDIQSNTCRLAFSGRLVQKFDPKKDTERLRLYTMKEKSGVICRLGDSFKRNDDNRVVRYEVYGSDLFKKETNMTQFIGLQVETETGDVGEIQSSFGTGGKFKVSFPAGTDARNGSKLFLRFKRYVHDTEKKIRQDATLPAPRVGTRIDTGQGKKQKKDRRTGNKNGSQGASKVMGKIASLKGEPLENGKFCIAIAEGLFTPEINIREKVGMVVRVVQTSEEGSITGSFGKAGKCKVSFPNGLSAGVGSNVELL